MMEKEAQVVMMPMELEIPSTASQWTSMYVNVMYTHIHAFSALSDK